jgi:hypothetical protein
MIDAENEYDNDEIEEDQESIYEEDYLDDDNDDGDDSLAGADNYE